jgi:hypothetical protein
MVYGFANSAETITGEIVNAAIENKARFGVVPFDL